MPPPHGMVELSYQVYYRYPWTTIPRDDRPTRWWTAAALSKTNCPSTGDQLVKRSLASASGAAATAPQTAAERASSPKSRQARAGGALQRVEDTLGNAPWTRRPMGAPAEDQRV
jgi:hypothetical protein